MVALVTNGAPIDLRRSGVVVETETFEKPSTNDNTATDFVFAEETDSAETSCGFNTKSHFEIYLSIDLTEVLRLSKAGDNTIIDYTTFVGVKTSLSCLNTLKTLEYRPIARDKEPLICVKISGKSTTAGGENHG